MSYALKWEQLEREREKEFYECLVVQLITGNLSN
jgi:hypothetical protein